VHNRGVGTLSMHIQELLSLERCICKPSARLAGLACFTCLKEGKKTNFIASTGRMGIVKQLLSVASWYRITGLDAVVSFHGLQSDVLSVQIAQQSWLTGLDKKCQNPI
jgi:hypothetical protein